MESNKITDYIKIPHLFKDIIFLLMGVNFILFLNFYYKPNAEAIPNFKYISDFGKLVFFLFLSYTVGRVLAIIANIWLDFWYLLFRSDLCDAIKSTYREFLGIANKEKYSIPLDLNNISHEIECFIQKNSYLRNEYERAIYSDTFVKGLLGFSIAVSFVSFSLYPILSVIILTILSMAARIKRSKMRKKIARAVTKEMAMADIKK